MKWTNTQTSWGLISQAFHWGMLLLIILQYTLAYTMANMPPSSGQKLAFIAWHKQIGVTLFLLVCLRLWWRMHHLKPENSNAPRWDLFLHKANITILYFLLFAFPLSGLLMSVLGGHSVNYFGLFTIPPFPNVSSVVSNVFLTIHIFISYILYIFVGLHILGAFYHHFIVKDNILMRMLPHR